MVDCHNANLIHKVHLPTQNSPMKARQLLPLALAVLPSVHAARSVRVRSVAGLPSLVVDGRAVPAHMFFNATSDRKLVADSLAQAFARSGIHLHQFDVSLDWSGDFDHVDKATADRRYRGLDGRLRALASIDPQVMVLLRVHVSPPQTWAEKHPDEVLTFQDGTKIFHSKWTACHSYASELWRQDAGERLCALIRHLQTTGLEEHVLGYLVFAGWSGEWNFFRQNRQDLPGKRYAQLSNMAVDHSPAMCRAFRAFLVQKYGSDATLRTAWRTDRVSLDAASPPTEEQVRTLLCKQLNSPAECAMASDYFECNAKQVADSLLHFARIARARSPNRINGAFFGEFMFTHIGGNRTPQRTGHADIDRVLASPHIDFICSPMCYQSRFIGGHSPSMCLVGSARLHGKLVWYEYDQATHLARRVSDKAQVPNRQTPTSLAETQSLMRRGFGYALTHGLGLWWWDQEGRWGSAVEGGVWYADDKVRAEFDLYQRTWVRAADRPQQVLPRPEIAVIYDPRSCFFQQSSWRDLSYDLIYRQVDALGKMGAPYDIFSLSDLGSIRNYKLYIVWNAPTLTDDQAKLLKELTQRRGVTTLWFYGPGYLSARGTSPERVCELTGLKVTRTTAVTHARLSPSSALVAEVGLGKSFGRDKPLDPAFRVDGGLALAVYEGTDVPAAATIERGGWRSFYFASAPLPSWVLRYVVGKAGCHQYTTTDDVVYVGPAHIVLHTAHVGRHVLNLPEPLTLRDAFTETIVARKTTRLELVCSGTATWVLEVSR